MPNSLEKNFRITRGKLFHTFGTFAKMDLRGVHQKALQTLKIQNMATRNPKGLGCFAAATDTPVLILKTSGPLLQSLKGSDDEIPHFSLKVLSREKNGTNHIVLDGAIIGV